MDYITQWDQIGEKTYEAGVDHGVLYELVEKEYTNGVAWSGLTSVAENPSGAEENAYYADNIKYLSTRGAEELGITIGCYTFPDEWEKFDGQQEAAPGVSLGQQTRPTFGLCYRTKLGNDTKGINLGFKLHLVYGCTTSPTERTYDTVNETLEPIEFSFDCSTTPVTLTTRTATGEEYTPTSIVTIKSTTADKDKLDELLAILYGDASNPDVKPRLPLPDEILKMFGSDADVEVTD